MLRRTTTRSFLKSFTNVSATRSNYIAASIKLNHAKQLPPLINKRPKAIQFKARVTTTSLLYATKAPPPVDKIDSKAEQKLSGQQLEIHPEEVSLGSSVRHVFEGRSENAEHGDEMLGGIKADLATVRETFALTDVPKESLYLGLAGVVPYVVTSASTVFLSYEINTAHAGGTGYLMSAETAHQVLDFITPIQIGYGAVIISFLGAIHWGLEYAGYGGYHSYRRFIYGVIAPAIAWPTIFMPVEYALITQFLAFNFLYFADARATARGWFPSWYSTYRFVLTFFVGASIVVSLIGRGQAYRHSAKHTSPLDYMRSDQDSHWAALEREEREKRHAAEEAGDEGEEEGQKSEDGDAEGDTDNEKKD